MNKMNNFKIPSWLKIPSIFNTINEEEGLHHGLVEQEDFNAIEENQSLALNVYKYNQIEEFSQPDQLLQNFLRNFELVYKTKKSNLPIYNLLWLTPLDGMSRFLVITDINKLINLKFGTPNVKRCQYCFHRSIDLTNHVCDVFNEEQLQFIQTHEITKMMGVPGGGKTKSIIAKIEYLCDTHMVDKKTDYLIATFSRKTKDDFLYKSHHTGLFTTNNVRTLHSIAGSIFKTSNNIQTCILGAYYKLVAENKIDNLHFKNLKYIFVDEAQDLSQIQYMFISKISEITGAMLVLIGDPNQNIYQFQNGSDKYLVEHPGERIQLVKNYRSTYQLVEFLNHFRIWKMEAPMICASGRNGPLPIVYGIPNDEMLSSTLLKDIRNYQGSLENIAILSPIKLSHSNNEGKTVNFGLQLVANILHHHNIPYTCHYSIEIEDDHNFKFVREQGKINLITIHSSKGAEFDKVILLNFHKYTMGRYDNTIETYNINKYLWYVGLSRVQTELSIYCCTQFDNRHQPCRHAWNGLLDCPSHLYVMVGSLTFDETFKKTSEIPIPFYTVTDTINKFNNQIDLLYDLDNKIEYEQDIVDIDNWIVYDLLGVTENSPIDLSALYGRYMDMLFQYYYYLESEGTNQKFLAQFKKNIHICIPKEFKQNVQKFQFKEQIPFSEVLKLKNSLNKKEQHVLEFLIQSVGDNIEMDATITTSIENNLYIIDPEKKRQWIQNLENNIEVDVMLFKLVLYEYQIEYECGYLFDMDCQQCVDNHSINIQNIKNFVKTLNPNLKLQIHCRHPNLPIMGRIDVLDEDKIIEIKYCNQISTKHIHQLLCYYNNRFPNWSKPMEFEIWNFKTGKKHQIRIHSQITNKNYLFILCDLLQLKMEHGIFLYDLETTGLIEDEQFGIYPDIIDRYVYEPYLEQVFSDGIVKTTKQISYEIQTLTGITQDEINGGQELQQFKEDLDLIYKYYTKPIFIAHNGNRFDHKIMKAHHLFKEHEEEICLDSRLIFSKCANLDYNLKLEEMYRIITNDIQYVQEHRAKPDVIMMEKILKSLHLTIDMLIDLYK